MIAPEFLSHLRTDRRGIPVPYVNIWGTEDVARFSIHYDRFVGNVAVFYDDSDGDVPDFTTQHMGRQRECMIGGFCQVCHRQVPWSRRRLVVAATSVEVIAWKGKEVPVVTEPWLCPRCAQFAVEHCPALIRKTREEQLTIIPVRSKLDCRIVISTGWIEGPFEDQSRREQPAMWAKLALTATTIKVAS